MTVPQRTYTDPTLNYLQGIQSLGGKEKTITGDPNATNALNQILQTQMGQLTPQGMKDLIAAIFEQGGKAVPVIATQFGQAAGARTSNNSGIAIANKNLQKELMEKSAQMIFQAQSEAAKTAGTLGALNKTQTTGSTASWMQALPFLPGILNKMGVSKLFEDGAASGTGTAVSFDQGSSALNGFSLGGTDTGGASYGFDVGGSFDAGGFDSFDAGSFDSFDGGDLGGFDVDASSSVEFVDGFEGFDLGFADGGLVSRKKLGMASKKPRGYADGGQVHGEQPRPVRGITDMGDNSVVPLLSAITGVGNDNSGARGFVAPVDPKKQSTGSDQNDGPGISVPSVVGTPDENAAAIAGLMGLAVSTALGIPAAVPAMAMSALGIPNSSMSPIGKSVSTIVSMISQAISGLGVSNDDSVAPPTEGGMSTVGPTGAGMSTTGGLSTSLGDSIAASMDGSGMTADSSSGDSGAGASSSGGTDGVGDAAAAGVDGGGFKKGGKIKGPGTETSDSIPITVSDGEYVLNAEATEMFLPMVEMMNAIGLKSRGSK